MFLDSPYKGYHGLLWWRSSKESAYNARDSVNVGLIPEEEITTHPSILPWRIPWTEEPGRLQAIGWQRVRHSWSN